MLTNAMLLTHKYAGDLTTPSEQRVLWRHGTATLAFRKRPM